MGNAPLTPDFIPHEWRGSASARLVDGFVDLTWPDGKTFAAYSLWLAENAEHRWIGPIIDHGDFHSRLRVLRRDRPPQPSSTTQGVPV